MKLSKIIIFSAMGLLTACTTAGPYVTNISSDGANGLNIEKCKVELNILLGVISTGDCMNSTIKLTTPNK